jgi:hypothetical protein
LTREGARSQDGAVRHRIPSRLLARLTVAVALLVPAPAAAQLRVGAGVEPLDLPEGVPLAGYSKRRTFPDVLDVHPYAHYFPPSEGTIPGEEVRAKALVLDDGTKQLFFVSLDLVGIEAELREKIVDGIAGLVTSPPLVRDAVIVSATHTHSGPGALSGNHFLEFAATDRLHADVRTRVVKSAVLAVSKALGNLQAAELLHFTTDAWQLHLNRRRDPKLTDPRLSLLAARAPGGGAWIGALLNFAVHGTAHDEDNNRLSADYPGALERAFTEAIRAQTLAAGIMQANPPPVLFLNGAEGDLTPAYEPDAMSSELLTYATATWAAWSASPPPPLAPAAWEIETLDVPLGTPFLYLRSQLKPFHDVFPFSHLGIELATYNPSQAKIWSIALAGLRLMSIPGEATADVGLELRKVAKAHGHPEAWVLGLTNDHLGYFASRDHWGLATYESGSSAYGSHGWRRLVNGHHHLLGP